jgi:hypothetical protein
MARRSPVATRRRIVGAEQPEQNRHLGNAQVFAATFTARQDAHA